MPSDRGIHNYGSFSRGLFDVGVYQCVAGVEPAAQIGRGDRHGGLFKENLGSNGSSNGIGLQFSYLDEERDVSERWNQPIAIGLVKIPAWCCEST